MFNGKLRATGWFDAELTRTQNQAIYDALDRGQPMEISTGLYTTNLPQEGSHNGRWYGHVAVNYRPDHLAILPDQVGACSVRDGCGLNVNSHQAHDSMGRFAAKLAAKADASDDADDHVKAGVAYRKASETAFEAKDKRAAETYKDASKRHLEKARRLNQRDRDAAPEGTAEALEKPPKTSYAKYVRNASDERKEGCGDGG